MEDNDLIYRHDTVKLDNFGELLSGFTRDSLASSLLNKEDEFMPILKNYIARHMDKLMSEEFCNSALYQAIQERDTRIEKLERQVEVLTKKLSNTEWIDNNSHCGYID